MANIAKRNSLAFILFTAAFLLLSAKAYAVQPVCGDGKREGWEECDNASANSDSLPNACRSNCVRASCGDGVVDSGEECDDGSYVNNNKIPNACRTDCMRAHCGDGVLDTGEECDDKNNNDYDGCSKCRTCYPPKDDLVISDSLGPVVRLCPGTYELQDKGQEGIIIITGESVRVDAAGVWLVGAPHPLATASQTKIQADKKVVSAVKGAIGSGISKMANKRAGRGQSGSGSGSNPPAQPPATPSGAGTTLRQGTGIVITGNNTVLHDAVVRNFKTGIKVKGSGNVLFNNSVCGNTTDIIGQEPGNFGLKDTCATVKDWSENNQPGCMRGCE